MSLQKRILIVDDEPNVRMVFRTALEAAGHEVAEASDGTTAISLACKSPFDLMLLDLKMPGTDGIETLKRLRGLGDQTPVVIVTAHGGVSEAVAAVKLGAVDFLPKPVSPTSLREVVSTASANVKLGRTIALSHALPETPQVATAAPPTPTPPEVRRADQRSPLFEEDLKRIRRAMDRREFDDAEFFLRVADALNPGAADVAVLREDLQARKKSPAGFSFRALGDLLR
ncbi:MAG: response regulator [Planctomycetaceae bacterium]|nr:response regulator [Planctomycetaceae bacterium]